jgi:hypothetical protein
MFFSKQKWNIHLFLPTWLLQNLEIPIKYSYF